MIWYNNILFKIQNSDSNIPGISFHKYTGMSIFLTRNLFVALDHTKICLNSPGYPWRSIAQPYSGKSRPKIPFIWLYFPTVPVCYYKNTIHSFNSFIHSLSFIHFISFTCRNCMSILVTTDHFTALNWPCWPSYLARFRCNQYLSQHQSRSINSIHPRLRIYSCKQQTGDALCAKGG